MVVTFTTERFTRHIDSVQPKIQEQLLYHCSHRMSAPLKTIHGLLNIMEIANETSQKNACIDMIQECISRLQDLRGGIEQIVMNEERGLCLQKISLHHLLDEITATLAHQIRSRQIIIRKEMSPSLELYSDNSRLRLLIMQLVSNAIIFCDNSKAERTVSISAHASEGNCIIIVKDNGIGIEESASPGLFRPFFRGSEKSGGPGLGLFLANGLAEKLGATLSVESVVGRGTAVTITIPG